MLSLYKTAYKDTATELRSAILDANLDLAISILTVNKDPKVVCSFWSNRRECVECCVRFWEQVCVFHLEMLRSSLGELQRE